MNRFAIASLVISLFAVSGTTVPTGQQLIVGTTPESFEQAIQLASDDDAARKFLKAYVVQARAGWGDGPLIGRFRTPFARVVQAAVAARRKGASFTTGNVTPDLIAPELHVIATSQKALIDDAIMATVQSVVLGTRVGNGATNLVQPIRTMELTKEYQDLTGTTLEGTGVVAIFPLSALTPNPEVRVVFDRVVRGAWGSAACRDCVVPLNMARIQ